MNIEINYGTTIYDDGSINKHTIYTFDKFSEFRTHWETRDKLSDARYTANIKKRTIECNELVDATEYLWSLDENTWSEEE